MDFTSEDILRLLSLGEGTNILWNLFLYFIFFLGLFTLFNIPDKNMGPTLLMATVLMFAVVAKLSIAQQGIIFRKRDFGMMVINIGMAVFSFITAGMLRSVKGKNRASGPAIVTGFFALVYWFLYLVVEQRQ